MKTNFDVDLPLEYYEDPDDNSKMKIVTSIDGHPAHLGTMNKDGSLSNGSDWSKGMHALTDKGGHSPSTIKNLIKTSRDIVQKKPKKYKEKNNNPDFFLQSNASDRPKIYTHPDDENSSKFTGEYLVDEDGNFSFSDLTERLKKLNDKRSDI